MKKVEKCWKEVQLCTSVTRMMSIQSMNVIAWSSRQKIKKKKWMKKSMIGSVNDVTKVEK